MRMVIGLSLQLSHYTKHRQPWLLPAVGLFMLPSLFTLSVNIVLIMLRSCRYAWQKKKRQAERSLSFSLSPSLFVSLAHLFTPPNKWGPGWGNPPMWPFATLCQPAECHRENITSANVALCDAAFKVENSAAREQLAGSVTAWLHVGGTSVRTKLQWKAGEWALCAKEIWRGGGLGTWHKWSLQLVGFGGSALIAAWPVGILVCVSQRHQRKEVLNM